MNRAIIGVIAAAIVIPVTVYAISPYFTESSIDEALPENVIPAQTPANEPEMIEYEEMAESVDAAIESGEMSEPEGMEPGGVVVESGEMAEPEEVTEEAEGMTAESVDMAEEAVLKTYEGRFVGVGDGIHDAQGIAKVLPLEDGGQILRLEDFRSTNGPDLYVYLATDKDASDFVSLGNLKANRGNQNYEIPADVDLEEYGQVLIWCKPFHVLFGNAELTAQR